MDTIIAWPQLTDMWKNRANKTKISAHIIQILESNFECGISGVERLEPYCFVLEVEEKRARVKFWCHYLVPVN